MSNISENLDHALLFWQEMESKGLASPDSPVCDGEIHRYKSTGDKAKNCWYVFHGSFGAFGSWKTGEVHRFSQLQEKMTAQERRANTESFNRATVLTEKELSERQDRASKRAMDIWGCSKPAPSDHTYLKNKQIQPNGARIRGSALVLPIQDFNEKFTSLQFIQADSSKMLLKGGRKKGCLIPVAMNRGYPGKVVICEGWATGCTLAENDPEAIVIAAIDAGNLMAVATTARKKWQNIEIIIAGDDDRLTEGNPGATKARDAAIASNGLLALPEWPIGSPKHLSDFNDLAVWLGAVT